VTVNVIYFILQIGVINYSHLHPHSNKYVYYHKVLKILITSDYQIIISKPFREKVSLGLICLSCL
jgi:hypothetical protein